MARAWRIEYKDALYHVLSRGNEQRAIVIDDEDRELFLDTLAQMSQRFEVDIFAFVLMDNHYHLLFRTRRANLSKSMQWFAATYTSRFNVKHNRSGHLFQGRFKNMLVENDASLLQLSHYIHRNPLRARMVRRLASYKWSSYRAYAYGKHIPKWLSTDVILSHFTTRQVPILVQASYATADFSLKFLDSKNEILIIDGGMAAKSRKKHKNQKKGSGLIGSGSNKGLK